LTALSRASVMKRCSFSARNPSVVPAKPTVVRRKPVQRPRLDQRAVDRGEVVEHLHEIVRGGVDRVGEVGDAAEVLGQPRQLRVELGQVGVHQLHVLADPLAAAAQRRRQRVEGGAHLLGLQRLEQRQQVVQRRRELARGLGLVLLDHVAVRQGLGRGAAVELERHELLAEQRLGQQPRLVSAGTSRALSGSRASDTVAPSRPAWTSVISPTTTPRALTSPPLPSWLPARSARSSTSTVEVKAFW
jgi:hypothetical protein